MPPSIGGHLLLEGPVYRDVYEGKKHLSSLSTRNLVHWFTWVSRRQQQVEPRTLYLGYAELERGQKMMSEWVGHFQDGLVHVDRMVGREDGKKSKSPPTSSAEAGAAVPPVVATVYYYDEATQGTSKAPVEGKECSWGDEVLYTEFCDVVAKVTEEEKEEVPDREKMISMLAEYRKVLAKINNNEPVSQNATEAGEKNMMTTPSRAEGPEIPEEGGLQGLSDLWQATLELAPHVMKMGDPESPKILEAALKELKVLANLQGWPARVAEDSFKYLELGRFKSAQQILKGLPEGLSQPAISAMQRLLDNDYCDEPDVPQKMVEATPAKSFLRGVSLVSYLETPVRAALVVKSPRPDPYRNTRPGDQQWEGADNIPAPPINPPIPQCIADVGNGPDSSHPRPRPAPPPPERPILREEGVLLREEIISPVNAYTPPNAWGTQEKRTPPENTNRREGARDGVRVVKNENISSRPRDPSWHRWTATCRHLNTWIDPGLERHSHSAINTGRIGQYPTAKQAAAAVERCRIRRDRNPNQELSSLPGVEELRHDRQWLQLTIRARIAPNLDEVMAASILARTYDTNVEGPSDAERKTICRDWLIPSSSRATVAGYGRLLWQRTQSTPQGISFQEGYNPIPIRSSTHLRSCSGEPLEPVVKRQQPLQDWKAVSQTGGAPVVYNEVPFLRATPFPSELRTGEPLPQLERFAGLYEGGLPPGYEGRNVTEEELTEEFCEKYAVALNSMMSAATPYFFEEARLQSIIFVNDLGVGGRRAATLCVLEHGLILVNLTDLQTEMRESGDLTQTIMFRLSRIWHECSHLLDWEILDEDMLQSDPLLAAYLPGFRWPTPARLELIVSEELRKKLPQHSLYSLTGPHEFRAEAFSDLVMSGGFYNKRHLFAWGFWGERLRTTFPFAYEFIHCAKGYQNFKARGFDPTRRQVRDDAGWAEECPHPPWLMEAIRNHAEGVYLESRTETLGQGLQRLNPVVFPEPFLEKDEPKKTLYAFGEPPGYQLPTSDDDEQFLSGDTDDEGGQTVSPSSDFSKEPHISIDTMSPKGRARPSTATPWAPRKGQQSKTGQEKKEFQSPRPTFFSARTGPPDHRRNLDTQFRTQECWPAGASKKIWTSEPPGATRRVLPFSQQASRSNRVARKAVRGKTFG